MMFLIAVFVSKIVSFLLLLSGRSASTWPGHIALKIDPRFYSTLLSQSSCEVVYVAGTNGKSTTRSLISHLLRQNGKHVVENKEGANLLNGLSSTLVRNVSFFGTLRCDCCVFEIDENTLPVALSSAQPSIVVMLNLFRDQLDRYGEVNTIAQNWKKALDACKGDIELVVNADDPLIAYLGTSSKNSFCYSLPTSYYEKKELTHDVDSIFCPICSHSLLYQSVSYSHLGDFKCKKCGFEKNNDECYCEYSSTYPLHGVYNIYNTNAALLASSRLLGVNPQTLHEDLKGFAPEFGRGEIIEYNNTKYCILLSKNPAGFNQSLEIVCGTPHDNPLLLLLNDNYADGRDVSWIWDVEFERLSSSNRKIILSGTRVWDLAVRMKYALSEKQSTTDIETYEEIEEASDKASSKLGSKHTVYVLATYTAMLDVRKHLVGRRLL